MSVFYFPTGTVVFENQKQFLKDFDRHLQYILEEDTSLNDVVITITTEESPGPAALSDILASKMEEFFSEWGDSTKKEGEHIVVALQNFLDNMLIEVEELEETEYTLSVESFLQNIQHFEDLIQEKIPYTRFISAEMVIEDDEEDDD